MADKDFLLSEAFDLIQVPAAFWSGCRKIIRGVDLRWTELPAIDLADFGYTKSKLSMLRRHYVNEESLATAVRLWEGRRERDKYGSVSFTTYNHYVKSEKKSPRGSVMGPCIQAVVITYLNKREYDISVYYRTTEFFKKFPADIALLHEMLARFDFGSMKCKLYHFHFVNLTLHPMYFSCMLPMASNRVLAMRSLKAIDSKMHDWVVKWLARYLIPKYAHGIQKFAQAMRTAQHAQGVLDHAPLKAYLEKNHPGYTHTRFEPEEE